MKLLQCGANDLGIYHFRMSSEYWESHRTVIFEIVSTQFQLSIPNLCINESKLISTYIDESSNLNRMSLFHFSFLYYVLSHCCILIYSIAFKCLPHSNATYSSIYKENPRQLQNHDACSVARVHLSAFAAARTRILKVNIIINFSFLISRN